MYACFFVGEKEINFVLFVVIAFNLCTMACIVTTASWLLCRILIKIILRTSTSYGILDKTRLRLFKVFMKKETSCEYFVNFESLYGAVLQKIH